MGNFFNIYQYVVVIFYVSRKNLGGVTSGFKKLGEKIKYYREKRGLSQKELAKRTFMTVSKLNEIENGTIVYQFWTLQKIAKALDVDLPELLNFE